MIIIMIHIITVINTGIHPTWTMITASILTQADIWLELKLMKI